MMRTTILLLTAFSFSAEAFQRLPLPQRIKCMEPVKSSKRLMIPTKMAIGFEKPKRIPGLLFLNILHFRATIGIIFHMN
jgi:hypothetical protein